MNSLDDLKDDLLLPCVSVDQTFISSILMNTYQFVALIQVFRVLAEVKAN